MDFALRKLLNQRAEAYARRRGFRDDAERVSIIDGWFAGFLSSRKRDPRVEAILENAFIAPATKIEGKTE